MSTMNSIVKSNKRKRLFMNTTLQINGFKPKNTSRGVAYERKDEMSTTVWTPETKLLSVENVYS